MKSTTRGFDIAAVIGFVVFVLAIAAMAAGCEGFQEYVREAGPAVADTFRDAAPDSITDVSGWIYAAGASLVTAGLMALRKYTKKDKPDA
jgi:hypothetical protein